MLKLTNSSGQCQHALRNGTLPSGCLCRSLRVIAPVGRCPVHSPRYSKPKFILLIAHVDLSGYYTDSTLKFRLTFPRNFPERPPTVHFVSDVFHPLVSQRDGLFNLAPRFHSWRYDILPHSRFRLPRVLIGQTKGPPCIRRPSLDESCVQARPVGSTTRKGLSK